MLNSISERRVRLRDKYKLYIEVPDKEYLGIYDGDVSENSARDVLSQYLDYHQDDARVDNVEVDHDKFNHSVNIQADLIYVGNDHTKAKKFIPNHLRTEKELEH